jgi:hypothetical protein
MMKIGMSILVQLGGAIQNESYRNETENMYLALTVTNASTEGLPMVHML